MCPVQTVTHVSGRSTVPFGGLATFFVSALTSFCGPIEAHADSFSPFLSKRCVVLEL
jgi:hypothetical protein